MPGSPSTRSTRPGPTCSARPSFGAYADEYLGGIGRATANRQRQAGAVIRRWLDEGRVSHPRDIPSTITQAVLVEAYRRQREEDEAVATLREEDAHDGRPAEQREVRAAPVEGAVGRTGAGAARPSRPPQRRCVPSSPRSPRARPRRWPPRSRQSERSLRRAVDLASSIPAEEHDSKLTTLLVDVERLVAELRGLVGSDSPRAQAAYEVPRRSVLPPASGMPPP